jgi:hypothetical protein
MATQDTLQAATQAIDAMTEDEVESWLRAGDYSTIGGVALPEAVRARISDVLATPEVEAYGFGVGFGLDTPSEGQGPSVNEGILGRKAGKGQQEFLKVTMTQVFVSSF